MSVAHGTAQPGISSGRPSAAARIATGDAAGPIMPPAAARSGTAASRGDSSAPPGSVASTISFTASAKKNTIADVVDREVQRVREHAS